jgi:hypothetical protein
MPYLGSCRRQIIDTDGCFEMLEIEVCEIRGKCPVYKVGDKIVIDDPQIVFADSDEASKPRLILRKG